MRGRGGKKKEPSLAWFLSQKLSPKADSLPVVHASLSGNGNLPITSQSWSRNPGKVSIFVFIQNYIYWKCIYKNKVITGCDNAYYWIAGKTALHPIDSNRILYTFLSSTSLYSFWKGDSFFCLTDFWIKSSWCYCHSINVHLFAFLLCTFLNIRREL